MPLIALNNVSVRLGGSWVLWDLALEVNASDLLAVFGRSGCGKTVLTELLAGLTKPTKGSVEWGEVDEGVASTNSLPSAAKGRSLVAAAFEGPAVANELTVYENLHFFASLSGIARRQRSRRIAYLLELLDLGSRRNARPPELSTGELKRVEIARVLLAGCRVTVIDSLLDFLERSLLERLWEHILSERREKGKTFLITTRSSRIAGLCPRLAVMQRGQIAFVGCPEDFRKLGGEDVIVMSELANPAVRERIAKQLSVVIKEEEGFLSFRVSNGEKAISSLLAEFGSDIGCVYLRRPTLDDALDVLERGAQSVAAYDVT
ncbi:MAG: ABC transporter ATP-binding protein [Armatimonadota bacterium]|nr:ABC transporter ATP-binding protein [Armatimonadota bacterium]